MMDYNHDLHMEGHSLPAPLSNDLVSTRKNELAAIEAKVARLQKLWQEYGSCEGENAGAFHQQLCQENAELKELCSKAISVDNRKSHHWRELNDYSLSSSEQLRWLSSDLMKNERAPTLANRVTIDKSFCRVIPIVKDGNSALRAISQTCYPKAKHDVNISLLRGEIVKSNIDLLTQEKETKRYEKMRILVDIPEKLSEERIGALIQEYGERMGKPGQSIGELEFIALADCLKRPIEIYIESDLSFERVKIFGEEYQRPTREGVKLLHVTLNEEKRDHYDLLKPST